MAKRQTEPAVRLDLSSVYRKADHTISGMADDMGLSRNSVRKLVSGDVTSVRMKTLAALCVYFSCDPSDILRLE